MNCAEESREPNHREHDGFDGLAPKTPPIRTASPVLASFVLYGERSIRLGERAHVEGGDVGVQAVSQSNAGFQVKIGACSVVDECYNVYSPSICLGGGVALGVVQTNLIEDDSVLLRSPVPFPAATMPPPPLAPLPAGSGADVNVAAGEVAVLLAGNYGAVTVIGTLLLNPGNYSFTSATLTDGARLVVIAGKVQISVAEYFTCGRRVRIFPAFRRPADHLVISVSGGDSGSRGDVVVGTASISGGTGTGPAISIGEHCFIRALVSAPQGTLAIADHTHAAGAFAAFDIAAGNDVRIDFQCGFPADAPGQTGTQHLQGYYGPNPDPTVAPLVGPVPADTIVPLAIGLPVRDPKGLQTFIQQVSDPKSPNFRKYLTQAQFTTTYGATDSDYQTVKDWATASGLSIYATYSNNLLLSVSGPAAQIQQALFVNLVYRLRADGSTFVAVDREPSLNLSVPVLRISGLAEFRLPQPAQVNGTGGCPGGNCGSSYRAADIRNAYLGPSLDLLSLDGTGQVVGLLELNSYSQSDIAGYDQLQIPQINPLNVFLNVVNSPPPFTSYSSSAETVLDIEMVQAMAPAAKVLVFQTALGATLHGDDVLHAMATSNPPLTSASCSYTFGRSDNSQQALDQMAANGVSFFTASGDNGDIGDPQSNLNMLSQTLVGGTNLATNALPPFTFPPSPPFPPIAYPNPYYAGETIWNQGGAPQSNNATGGGIMNGNNKNGNCNCWPYSLGPFSCCGSGVAIPDWQVGIMAISAGANGGSTTWRNYPDVAMLANNIEIFYNGQPTTSGGGGTSAAAPLWAGFMALVNQRIKSVNPSAGTAGFLNTTLYDIGLTSGLADDLYQLCFNDIVGGNNFHGYGPGFNCVPGYDLCTGLGTPKPGLIYQLSSPHPNTKDQPLDLIRFAIGTGHDNLRGNGGFGSGCNGTGCTADILFPGYDLTTGVGVKTVTLKAKGTSEEWAENSTTTPPDFAIDIDNAGNRIPPPTPSNGIVGVRLNIQEDYGFPCTADNWDVTTLQVWLFNPPFSAASSVCQLNLVGTATLQDGHIGLVRLSEHPGGSGVGTSSPIFLAGQGSPGCP